MNEYIILNQQDLWRKAMFEKIPFTNIVAKNRLLSKNLTKKEL